MDNLLKPYEVSVWEDVLVNETVTDENGTEDISYYKERKIAVIGSNDADGLNYIYDIVFHKDKNGEKSLSFKLKYKYFNPVLERVVVNPFSSLLINERKVKLYYDNEWYDFIIKEQSETSEEYEWSYEAQDAFVLELSKTGYNIDFNTELNNNQGNAAELALRALEDTDWEVVNIDVDQPRVNEPIYSGKIVHDITVKEMDSNTDITIEAGENGIDIYIFYTYIADKNGKFLQFILKENEPVIDSNNNIISLNYRFEDDVIINDKDSETGIGTITNKDGVVLLQYGDIYTKYQAYKVLFKQITTYDPIMERTVDQFSVEDEDIKIYHYQDYVYTTSNVVYSYIANGSNFNVYENGSLQGWSKHTAPEEEDRPEISLVTYPQISTDKSLFPLDRIKSIEGYLKMEFYNNIDGPVLNNGIEHNIRMIQSISQGEPFILRWRGGKNYSDDDDKPQPLNGKEFRVIVAYYDKIKESENSIYTYADINELGIILEFKPSRSQPTPKLNNIIKGGILETNEETGDINYVINGIIQEPSTKYIYQVDNEGTILDYIWDSENNSYIRLNNNYLEYYYLTANAKMSVSSDILSNPNTHIGIFIYPTDTNLNINYFIQDIQLTRLFLDKDGLPVTEGNIPTATTKTTDYYYVAPMEGTDKNRVETFLTLEAIADNLGISVNKIKPIYNNDLITLVDQQEATFRVHNIDIPRTFEQFIVLGYSLEKVLSIEASKTNCFDILQTIAETFECWVDLQVEHDEDGALSLDYYGKPLKQVYLRQYGTTDNFAGFKYGINLNSIERIVDSNEIVTKLIVDDIQSDYVDSGIVSIQNAESNISGENYILNFDYYFNNGIIEDKEEVHNDLFKFNDDIRELNNKIKAAQQDLIYQNNAFTKVSANRNTYTTLVQTAEDELNEALDRFYLQVGQTYEDYQAETEGGDASKLEIESVADTVAKIYTNSSVINNYQGFVTNSNLEYEEIKKIIYGVQEHVISFSRVQDETDGAYYVRVVVDDYIVPFGFTLDGEDYKTTVNIRTFDLRTNKQVVDNFVYDTNTYTLCDSKDNPVNSVWVSDDVVVKIRLVPKVQVLGLKQQIDDLLKQKRERLKEFNTKYSRFLLEGTWNSQDYINDELYYLDAVQTSNVAAFPKVTYNINVAEISGIEDYELYTFDTGHKTFIEDTEFFGWTEREGLLTPAREEVIVAEIEWHLDNPSINNITIQNYKSNFADLFQRIQATVQTVQYNEATYAKTSSIIDKDGTLNEEVLLKSLNKIGGKEYALTSDGSIITDGDSILVRNLTNSANRVKINSEGILISSDGGNTWSAAITGQGINIGNVFSSFINTNRITIGSKDNPSFHWDSNGLSAYKYSPLIENKPYDLSTFVRFDQYGLYGIKLDSGFVAHSLEDVENKARFAITWNGFFIRNTYTGGNSGRVEITSKNDFRVIKTVNGADHTMIHIGAIEKDNNGNPLKYGIIINNLNNSNSFKATDDGELSITGIINARGGNFSERVYVGKDENDQNKPYIIIDGRDSTDATISSSKYQQDGASYGWIINADGDAVFNNIVARGAIKTAVFEYAEVQAVGGVFIFRPSSRIKTATLGPVKEDPTEDRDLILTVEKPALFKADEWCKVSNYTDHEEGAIDPYIINNGLTHVYKVSREQGSNNIILLGGARMVIGQDAVISSADKLIGGVLIDMGNKANGNGKVGTNNYGIGINSSDNTVNLPARAITLFETIVDETKSVRVTYDLRGILGTLPRNNKLGSLYTTYLEGTQGIYTDNIYIGDNAQYMTFYTDKNDLDEYNIPKKKLRISGADIYLTPADEQSGTTIVDIVEELESRDGLVLTIDSTNGFVFNTSAINTTLIAHVFRNGEEMTAQQIATEGWQIVWYFDGNKNYLKTQDTEVVQGKIYYTYNTDSHAYIEVNVPVLEDLDKYYELSNSFIGQSCVMGGEDMVDITVKIEDIVNNESQEEEEG